MEQRRTKKCRICGKEKEENAFFNNIAKTDRLSDECRECRHRAYRQKHGGVQYALRNLSTDEIIDEIVRRAKIFDLLEELSEEDIVKYLENLGYLVMHNCNA